MIKIKIDNEIVFDGDQGEWIAKPPDLFRDVIKPGVKPKPYLKAVGVILADALITNANMTIAVTTKQPGKWTMTVTER